MLMYRLIRVVGWAGPLLASFPLRAQVTGDLSVFVGYYRPFGQFDPASVYSTSLPESPDALRAAAWGGAGHIAFHGRFGVLAQFAATRSRVPQVITPGGPRGPTDARVLIATVQGQYDVSPSPRTYHLWLNAGPGVVHHGGQAYAAYGSPTSFAGALGATLAVPVVAHLQFTADAMVLFYRIDIPMPSNLRLNPGSLERGTQQDALLHTGLAWSYF